jgi:hypothetical protein
MTVDEAKELLIEGINYAAYRETNHSLWDADKDKLFGAEHYQSGRPIFEASVWGDGEIFEAKMTELLRWVVKLGSTKGSYKEAIKVLQGSDQYLNRIIGRAGV